MTGTVRIGRGHDARDIVAICRAMVFVTGEYSKPGAFANGTGVRACVVRRRAGQP
jgi:hypothetical protein